MSLFRIFYIVLVTLLTMRSPRDFVLQRLRRNDETLRNVTITERWEAIEIFIVFIRYRPVQLASDVIG